MGNTHRQKMRTLWSALFCAALGGLLIAGCTPQKAYLVYTQKAYLFSSNQDIYLSEIPIPPNSSTSVPLAVSPDPEFPCGATSDGWIVYTRVKARGGGIYAVKADGSGLTGVIDSVFDERCMYVSPDGVVIYQERSGTPRGDDIWTLSIQGGALVVSPYPLANDPQSDEQFLAMAPDRRVIFARADPGTFFGGYDLHSHILAPTLCSGIPSCPGDVLAMGLSDPHKLFDGVTPDNHVIYSATNGGSYMGSLTEVYSVKTDGTSGMRIAANPFDNSSTIHHEQQFCALDRNRVVFTDRYTNRAGREFGDLYLVGADGSGRTKLPISGGDITCNAVTYDGYVIYTNHLGPAQDELLSIKTDWNMQEYLLAPAPGGVTNRFEAITPLSQVVFSSSSCNSTGSNCTASLNAVDNHGTRRATLTLTGGERVEAVADPVFGYETVIYAQVPPGGTSYGLNLYVWPRLGGAPIQIAPSSENQAAAFVFYR